MIPLEKLERLAEGGYEVVWRGGEVLILYTTPTLADAASSPQLPVERRRFVIRGVVEGEYVKLVEAYVEEGGGSRRAVDIRDLELWVEYVKNL